jgi:hypothetical protein
MRNLESLLDTEFAAPDLIKLDVRDTNWRFLKGAA